MANYFEKEIICPCCKKIFTARVAGGFLANGDMGMDTFPYHPAVYDSVVICPHCSYATEKLYSYPKQEICDLVESREYRGIVSDFAYEQKEKNHLAASFLAKADGDFRRAGRLAMTAFWHMRERDSDRQEEALAEAIECYSTFLSKKADLDAAVILIDLLRQQGDFSEAADTAHSLISLAGDKERYVKLAGKELRWIEAGDSAPHKVSEV